jgi:hypothetical protein
MHKGLVVTSQLHCDILRETSLWILFVGVYVLLQSNHVLLVWMLCMSYVFSYLHWDCYEKYSWRWYADVGVANAMVFTQLNFYMCQDYHAYPYLHMCVPIAMALFCYRKACEYDVPSGEGLFYHCWFRYFGFTGIMMIHGCPLGHLLLCTVVYFTDIMSMLYCQDTKANKPMRLWLWLLFARFVGLH